MQLELQVYFLMFFYMIYSVHYSISTAVDIHILNVWFPGTDSVATGTRCVSLLPWRLTVCVA